MAKQVLDLFAGAGGMSLGFSNGGFDVIAGVDVDDKALETYDRNHDAEAINCDLATVDPQEFANEYDIHKGDIDGVVGGPSCQGFSVANHDRDPDDPRNNLVFRFAKYVGYYQPDFFVMENVTGLKSIDDGETLELLIEDFEDRGYDVEWSVLNAADYGVPQKRKRVFVIGVHEDVDGEPTFPEPTHAPKKEVKA